MTEGAVPFIDGRLLGELLPFSQAVDALAAAFSSTRADAPPRTALQVPGGELLLMPAHGREGVGVKLVTLNPDNPSAGRPLIQGMYVLFSADGLRPELMIDGAALTGRRTAAVSALATDRLARDDARRLVVFGAGPQARAHVEAMLGVRAIERVGIIGRDPSRARALAEQVRAELGLRAESVSGAAIADADIVCTCTTSHAPLFDDRWLAPGTHINAIGAYRPDMRELPAATLARALVAVESVGAALEEAGDFIQAIAEGAWNPAAIAGELADLALGRVVRTRPDQVTVFKSVGIATEDLVLARAVADRLG
jgi:ornithine cyclodeaminase/alanine dehydrogenase-like protein (mu-crystallin family)